MVEQSVGMFTVRMPSSIGSEMARNGKVAFSESRNFASDDELSFLLPDALERSVFQSYIPANGRIIQGIYKKIVPVFLLHPNPGAGRKSRYHRGFALWSVENEAIVDNFKNSLEKLLFLFYDLLGINRGWLIPGRE